MTETILVYQVLIIVFLIFLSAFFSSSETAITSISEDVLQKEIDDVSSELYRANSILNADGPYVGKRTYNKLLSDVYVAQAKLDKLIAKRDALFNKIDSKIDDNLSDNCNKMTNHIDFIESIYIQLKNPIEYITTKITGKKKIKTIKSHETI